MMFGSHKDQDEILFHGFYAFYALIDEIGLRSAISVVIVFCGYFNIIAAILVVCECFLLCLNIWVFSCKFD